MSKPSSKRDRTKRAGSRGSSERRGRRSSVVAARGGTSGWLVAAVVLLVAFAGAVGFGIYRSQHSDASSAAPMGADGAGVTVGRADAPATVDIYLDLQCPVCRDFEQRAGTTIDQLVAGGKAKVIYHPMAFLDEMSSTNYSSRAAAASGCAADASVLPPFLALLYQNQPPEDAAGLTDDQLIAFGKQAGAGDQFTACVNDHRYTPWVKGLTDKASQAGINATPTVLVNGQQIEHTPQALTDAVNAVH